MVTIFYQGTTYQNELHVLGQQQLVKDPSSYAAAFHRGCPKACFPQTSWKLIEANPACEEGAPTPSIFTEHLHAANNLSHPWIQCKAHGCGRNRMYVCASAAPCPSFHLQRAALQATTIPVFCSGCVQRGVKSVSAVITFPKLLTSPSRESNPHVPYSPDF